MATQAAVAANARRPAGRPASAIKDAVFQWDGRDRGGRVVSGEMRAGGQAQVQMALRRQGIQSTKIKKRRMSGGRRVKRREIATFTRQMATMMKAGVPLLQSFDIVARGNPNPGVTKLLNDIRSDVETGTSLSAAFRKYPLYFNDLYCNLVEAGEQAGILEDILNRLSSYLEKTEKVKSKVKGALMYPCAVVVVAIAVVAVIMIWVIPTFKSVFESFGADLPAPTLMVVAMSEFILKWKWVLLVVVVVVPILFFQAWKRSPKMQIVMDRLLLQIPIFGPIVRKSVVARWTRTLSTMFSAGVPLVEVLDSVGGASGNYVYKVATDKIQQEVAMGTSLTAAMSHANVFPSMVLQMTSIGEESGALDHMVGKAADFYEDEVDQAVAGLSSLMEPIIIVFLGVIIGGIVVSMYLPIFKMGSVV
ncbi:MAG: type II secretion system F family protein [Burkholderiaceae bacterium]|jgi:type IV pilus assembly protein PilC|nr:type II secretion system F family protein [Burkholderiaceae bacterium]